MNIEQVAKLAKEMMLEHGSHSPIVIVEGTEGGFASVVDDFSRDHQEKIKGMAKAGFSSAMQRNIGILKQVFFIAEGWMSMAKDGKVPDVAPSQDPARREVLMVTGLEVEGDKTSFLVFEVVRDTSEKVVELKEVNTDGMEGRAESPLLPAFVHGFKAGSYAKLSN